MVARQYNFGDIDSGPGVGEIWFGTGFEGDVTVPSSSTITTDKFYENLTIPAGIVFKTAEAGVRAPCKIRIRGTLTINGRLDSGYNGTHDSNGLPSGNGTTFLPQTIGGSGNGGSIGSGAASNGGTGGAGSIQRGFGGAGGAGGVGGNGSGGRTGGAAGSPGANPNGPPFYNFTDQFWSFNLYAGGGSGGSGGGGGAGDGTNAGANGGAGGSGGGVIWIAADAIVVNVGGAINADGAPGNVGSNAAAVGNRGGGAGGGGGGGGLIMLGYNSFTLLGTISAAGGAGGIGGSATGTGLPGNNGSAGSDGKIILYNFATGEYE